MTARIFIDGEAGTTGLGIAQRLRALPDVTLISLDEAARKDVEARKAAMAAADLVVLCLPDTVARETLGMVTAVGLSGAKFLDASSAHRTAFGWVYGFAELTRGQDERIATARYVSNPGCYATGAIALLRPLVEAGVLPEGHEITINAVSGYSGGGKAMIAAHEAEGGPAYELYALGLDHKHVPEIRMRSKLTRRPIFMPSVGHFRQGMLVSVPLFLRSLPGWPNAAALLEVYRAHYRDAPRIAVRPPAATLTPQALNDTDGLEIFVAADAAGEQAVLTARLDNLGKGASGAAVQNIALMLGLALPAANQEAA